MHSVGLIPSSAPSHDPASRATNDEATGACIKSYARDIRGLVDLECEHFLPSLRKVSSTQWQVQKFELTPLRFRQQKM